MYKMFKYVFATVSQIQYLTKPELRLCSVLEWEVVLIDCSVKVQLIGSCMLTAQINSGTIFIYGGPNRIVSV